MQFSTRPARSNDNDSEVRCVICADEVTFQSFWAGWASTPIWILPFLVVVAASCANGTGELSNSSDGAQADLGSDADVVDDVGDSDVGSFDTANDSADTGLFICGDGFRDPGEACDDGDQVDDDSCSNTCVENPGGDAALCEPCVEDLQCGGTDDLCLTLDDGSFCGRSCVDEADECPQDYECQLVNDLDIYQCSPISNACVVCTDSDLDLTCDFEDLCPGFDDRVDSDEDTVPDGCDVCASGDDNLDDDGDDIPDPCDLCPLGDNTVDGDEDTVPDACDRCQGADDRLDADGDMMPDFCDVCPGGDDLVDDDEDGVPNDCDRCMGFNDEPDADFDTVPDGCDVCPNGDDRADADFDTVPNYCDVCTDGDDRVDTDSDDVPDDCDVCPLDVLDDSDSDGVCDSDDVCAGFNDAIDPDGDGVPAGCDVCPEGDDTVDADDDGVPDRCDLCGTSGPSILLYDPDSAVHLAAAAVDALGCEATLVSAADFVDQLNTGEFDLIVMDMPRTHPDGAWTDALIAYVDGGGALVMGTLDLDDSDGTRALAFELGVEWLEDRAVPQVLLPESIYPTFESPFDLSGSTMTPSHDLWPSDVGVLDGANLSLVIASLAEGEDVIVLSNQGRALLSALAYDDWQGDEDGDFLADGMEMVANHIAKVWSATGPDFLGLPYDFHGWDAEGAALLHHALTDRYAGNTPRVVAIQECVDQAGETLESNPGGVTLGEYNSTLAALAYAGHDPSEVFGLPDYTAAVDLWPQYDVILFMEQELCDPEPNWELLLVFHHLWGGRVVVTTPRNGTADFISESNVYGEGTEGVLGTPPFTTVSDPFWDTVVHPTNLSSTTTWVWSGDLFDPLATDVDGNTTIWRVQTIWPDGLPE